MTTRTDTDYVVSYDPKTGKGTLTFDLQDVTTRPATSSGRAYSVASSHGWQDFGPAELGLRLSLNLVASKKTLETLAALKASLQAETEASAPKTATRTRKAA